MTFKRLTANQRDVLAVLAHMDGEMDGQRVYEALHHAPETKIALPHVFTTLNHLAEIGYVEQATDAHERMVDCYQITAQGEKHLQAYQDWLQTCLSAEERSTV